MVDLAQGIFFGVWLGEVLLPNAGESFTNENVGLPAFYLEESFTALTRFDAVVLTGSLVSAYRA